jgi:hypothetical protein
MYELYKPLRNFLRRTSLIQSLGVIRAYMQFLAFGQPFPNDIEVHSGFLRASRAENGVYEWELELLAKELILNAPEQGELDLRSWGSFSNSLNLLKKLEDGIAQHYEHLISKNILLEMYRIAHRQFPWQHRDPLAHITRYLKIFGRPSLDLILRERIGLGAQKLYLIGMSLMGVFVERFGLSLPARVEVAGLTQDDINRFIDTFASSMKNLREQIAKSQSYDQDYAYAFNPLKITPLVLVDVAGRSTLIAPVPAYLLQRFTEGVYYEIYDAPGFAAAFGDAFQTYVGDVLAVVNQESAFEIQPEAEYYVGKDRKDSVDWIVSDDTAEMFIECKTKRIRYAAKMAIASTEVLDEDLDKMASFVVQIYKTLADAQNGLYPNWKPSDRPLYPIVLTLEDWYVFGERIVSQIDLRVVKKLADVGLHEDLLRRYPYTICTVAAFERAVQVMADAGIRAVMNAKTFGEQRMWELHSLLVSSFGEAFKNTRRNLFPECLDAIRPEAG